MEIALAERTPATERELVLRAQAGESAAFGELVQRYMRRAYFAALGLVGSPEDARDLSQEAFVRAFRARQRINPDLPFYAWLYQGNIERHPDGEEHHECPSSLAVSTPGSSST